MRETREAGETGEERESREQKGEEKKPGIKSLLSGEKLRNLIIFAGILGIALIFLSSLTGEKNEKTEAETEVSSESRLSSEEYAAKLEESLEKIISEIDGAGKTSVLITIDREIESVYQTDTISSVKTESGSSQSDSRSSTVIIKDGSSTEKPIKVTEIMPKIKGVVVVCEGADSSVVKQNVTESVRTALGVSSSRVSVQKYSRS